MRPLEPEVTRGPREDILVCVRTIPGIHLRDIERRARLPLGQVLYHLDRLERMGLVVSSRDHGFRRYFASGHVARGEKRYLSALRHDVPRRLVLRLLERPGPRAHKELQQELGVAGSTLSFHLQRLLTSGVLVREPRGASNLYHLADPDIAQRELVYYRGSFDDPEVDAYVRQLLDRLPPSLPSGAVPAP